LSPRNNEDRLGAKQQAADAPVPSMTNPSSNEQPPPLNFVTPTEFVELPSGGEFYPEDHPLHMKDSVEVRHMTAKDEDILTSKTLLKKGIALDRFLQNIIIDRSIKVDDLLVGDKNAIIVAARISGYGPDYTTKITCPSCTSAVNHTFDLNDNELITGESYKQLDAVTRTDMNTFLVKLPYTGIDVEVRLMNGHDEKSLIQKQERAKKRNLPETFLTDQLRKIIVSANGDSSPKTINYLIENMPAIDSRYLRQSFKVVAPNLDLTQTFSCSECGFDTELEVPFSAEFFWPKSRIHGAGL